MVALEVLGVIDVRHGDGAVVLEQDVAAGHSAPARLTHEISDLVRESRLESLAHIELVSDVAVLREGDGPAA